jgi:transcription elongation GreA/GreB family factor
MRQDYRENMLDSALAATFPASDALSIVQPGGGARPQHRSRATRPPASKALVGSTVTYREVGRGMQRTVTLVAPTDHDPDAGNVSVDSPVGRSLVGRRQGSSSVIRAPVGIRMPIQILRVTPTS